MTLLTYRFALDPTQERALRSQVGAARVAFNWGLARVKAVTVAPAGGKCSKEAFDTGLDQLARALKNWGDSRKGKRKGEPVGFPRFKSKRKARPSVRPHRTVGQGLRGTAQGLRGRRAAGSGLPETGQVVDLAADESGSTPDHAPRGGPYAHDHGCDIADLSARAGEPPVVPRRGPVAYRR